MNGFHTEGEYVLAGLESSHKAQIWDWEPAAAQAQEAPFFGPFSYGLPAIGGAGYPFQCPAGEAYPVPLVKNEDDRCVTQIGLNLGRRTYFPSGEAAAIEQLFRRSRGLYQASQQIARCQAEGCKADLATAKHYHRRHKVCELHSKATVVVAGGVQQRFCQQCSRFHPLCEFDEAKRSCRKRLAEHNRRRRKAESSPAPSSSSAGVDRSDSANNSATIPKDRLTHSSSDPSRNFVARAHGEEKFSVPTKSIPSIMDENKTINQHWRGPSLSLGGGSAQEKAHSFGFFPAFHAQLSPWVIVPNDNNSNSANQRLSSSTASLFVQPQVVFCNGPAEASHSAAIAGQGLLEVDFL